MHAGSKDGYLLIDIIISIFVVSLVIATTFRYHSTASRLTRNSYIDHQRLHNIRQVMEAELYTKTSSFLPKDSDISVNDVPFDPDTIQEKPHRYSFDFEKNFVFVVATESEQNKKPLIMISGKHRGLQ